MQAEIARSPVREQESKQPDVSPSCSPNSLFLESEINNTKLPVVLIMPVLILTP